MNSERSKRADVRNPMLTVPEVLALQELPDGLRIALARALAGCSSAFRARGNEAWSRHKPPMAAYWKANAVNFRHLALAIRPRAQHPAVQEAIDAARGIKGDSHD